MKHGTSEMLLLRRRVFYSLLSFSLCMQSDAGRTLAFSASSSSLSRRSLPTSCTYRGLLYHKNYVLFDTARSGAIKNVDMQKSTNLRSDALLPTIPAVVKSKKQKSKKRASAQIKGEPQPKTNKASKKPKGDNLTESKKSSAAKSSSKSNRKKIVVEPIHWILPSDPLIWIPCPDSSVVSTHRTMSAVTSCTAIAARQCRMTLRFTVRGNPLPLRRHRTSRGFVYNPSAKAQESFRATVQALIRNQTAAYDSAESVTPLFGSNATLAMQIIFRSKRPKIDFVRGRPGAGCLRNSTNDSKNPAAPTQIWPPTRMDVDNLAKFVLDSLNGLLYEDDRQVVSLHVTKLRDDQDECKGSTEVCLRVVGEEDLNTLLSYFDTA
jgi:Holliday junction resolvase RusA-like endonuclease